VVVSLLGCTTKSTFEVGFSAASPQRSSLSFRKRTPSLSPEATTRRFQRLTQPPKAGPSPLKGLSKRDLELVTLWLLSSTHVGPQDSAADIQAERYKQVASLTHKPVINRLPQTGSSLPWGTFEVLLN
jgi:hypothetical protein